MIPRPSFEIVHPSTDTSADSDHYIFLPGLITERVQTLTTDSKSPSYLIGRSRGVCGGAPIVLGTRISVHQLIELLQRVGNRDQIQIAYSHLTMAQIDAAIEYYNANPTEIEDLIEAERQSEFDKKT